MVKGFTAIITTRLDCSNWKRINKKQQQTSLSPTQLTAVIAKKQQQQQQQQTCVKAANLFTGYS